MRQDARLRAATQAIYDAVYPSDEWSPVGFDEAGRCGTIHYHQAVDAAQRARGALASTGEQLPLALVARGFRRRHKGHFLADEA